MKRDKKFFLVFVSLPFRLIPRGIRVLLLKGLMAIESRIGSPEHVFGPLFDVQDFLSKVINESAIRWDERGIHPKHYLTDYHDFFSNNVGALDVVLDLGCGYGAVVGDLATSHDRTKFIGLDKNVKSIEHARRCYQATNLRFESCDFLTQDLNNLGATKVILSNVLEHLDERIEFLRKLSEVISVKALLIRVPSIERDWSVSFRRHLKLPYFCDSDHRLEYTHEILTFELNSGGWQIQSVQDKWGEIWAVCIRSGEGRPGA